MTMLPLTEAKARLNELVGSAVTTHERVTITRHGKPAAVLISVDDLESLLETLYWQAAPSLVDDISRSDGERDLDDLWDEAAVRRRYGVGKA